MTTARKHRRALVNGLLLSIVATLQVTTEAADSWTQWRGPARDGQCGQVWPNSLDEDRLRLQFQLELGPSYSGPIVADDSIFVTETHDEREEVVRALSREDGHELWQARWNGAMRVPFFARANGSWIRSTPAYDGDSVYVAGMKDVLVCLNAANGTERWRVDFVEACETSVPAFGFVCSPLVAGDHVYVQAGASLAKLDKHSGRIVWRALTDSGGMMGSAFSSPILAQLAGREQLLVQTRQSLAGVDAETGDVLWSRDVPAFRGMNILTPTVHGNGVFTSSYGGKSFLFTVAAGSEGKCEVRDAWENKLQGYMSTPVVIDGHAYLHLRNQRFACIDLESGTECWISKPFGKYWSLVASGDRILALDERGELLLIQADPEKFQLVDRRQVSDDSTWAHLAVADGQVFVRALRSLSVYRWQ